MLKRVKEDFIKGIEKIKWFSTVLSERLKIEIAIIKLLYRSNEMEKQKAELLSEIGERVYDLREYPEKNIIKDRSVQESIRKIGELEKEIEEVNRRVREIGQAGA